jgi:hypothetical protein
MNRRNGQYVLVLAMTFLVAFTATVFSGDPTKDYLKELSGRFARSPEGVITDRKTRLCWRESPDFAMTWNQAQTWIASLGKPWRTPTIDELKGIYVAQSARKGQPLAGLSQLDLRLDPVFVNNSYMVWSGANDAATAWYFGFYDGVEYWHPRDASIWRFRALAVAPSPKKAGKGKSRNTR